MQVDEGALLRLPARFAMVDGCFDPLHRGHIAYFREAAELGLPVLCNLACDDYLRDHKRREPLLAEDERAAVIDAVRYIDYVFLARHGTAYSLHKLRPAYYVKGADWEGRLPPEQVAVCQELGIQIVFVDCTLNSSTRILQTFLERGHVHHTV